MARHLTAKEINELMRMAQEHGAHKAAQMMDTTAETAWRHAKKRGIVLPSVPRAKNKAYKRRDKVPACTTPTMLVHRQAISCPGCRWALMAGDDVASCFWQKCPKLRKRILTREVKQG